MNTTANLLQKPIAASRARVLLAYPVDMFRRTLCGFLRSAFSQRLSGVFK